MIALYTKVGSKIFKRENDFFQFPGGEWHLKNDGETYVGNEAAIVCGTDPNDYVKLALWQNCCKEYPNIVMPYLPAARSDRGTPCGAAVYANLIPNYRKLVVFDAHSNYMVDYLKATHGENVVNVEPHEIIGDNHAGYTGIIAPDKGATKRAQGVADKWGIPLLKAEKKRDFDTGQLLGYTPPENLDPWGSYLVVDDICDGGGTFILLHDSLRAKPFHGRLHLFVSHGIFSKGYSDLLDRYPKIWTTNSLGFVGYPEVVQVTDIRKTLLRKAYEV